MAEAPDLRIAVFSGSPLSAPLIARLQADQQLAAVVLPENGRADVNAFAAQLQSQYAGEHPLELLAYRADKQAALLQRLAELKVNLFICCGFGEILPPAFVSGPGLGAYNLHAAPLPAWRGADPLFWQLKSGQAETQLCLHRLTTQVDAGPIVQRETLDIHPCDTWSSLAAQVAQRAPELIQPLLAQIQSLGRAPQGEAQAASPTSTAPRPQVQDILVDWSSMSAAAIANLARAANGPLGGARIAVHGVPTALLQATPQAQSHYGTPAGTVMAVSQEHGLQVATTDGRVQLDVLASADGVFSGLAFAERFQIDAGLQLGSLAAT